MESWGNARRGVERCCRGGLRLCGCCNLSVSEKWWRGQEGELCSSPSGPWRKHTDPGPPPLPTSLFHHHSTCAIYDSPGRSRVARSEDICESSCGGSASLFFSARLRACARVEHKACVKKAIVCQGGWDIRATRGKGSNDFYPGLSERTEAHLEIIQRDRVWKEKDWQN